MLCKLNHADKAMATIAAQLGACIKQESVD